VRSGCGRGLRVLVAREMRLRFRLTAPRKRERDPPAEKSIFFKKVVQEVRKARQTRNPYAWSRATRLYEAVMTSRSSGPI
jgi:hypothetical protein